MDHIEDVLKYHFRDQSLLQKALTHGSVDAKVDANYERLEFLGDRVLGVAVASLLYKIFPLEPEGNLSQRFVCLVCKETVAQVALDLKLNEFMYVLTDDLRHNENVLCDVCEAVIGAIYVDAGVDAAIEFVNHHWRDLIDRHMSPPKDSKTKLQELSHHLGYGTPQYKMVARFGSEHEPVFEVEVRLDNGQCATGKGKSKKLAEFAAASSLLEMVE